MRYKKLGLYRSNIKTAYGYCVPLLDQLTTLLSMPEVQSVNVYRFYLLQNVHH